MAETLYWDKEELKKLVESYGSVSSVTLKAAYNEQDLWQVKTQLSFGEVSNLAKNSSLANRVFASFDRIGVTEIKVTEVMTKESKRITQENWAEWFLAKATLGYDSMTFSAVEIVPDTNFIMRRYASGLLRRLGETSFCKLRFRIPNLVILEIEGIYNRAKKTSETMLERAKSSTLNDKEEQELTKVQFDCREALIATKELMFLREQGAVMLESNLQGTPHKLSEITDMYIRREIREAVKNQNINARFSTCDLMNALSAVAEGLPTFYFSRIPTERLFLSDNREIRLEQIADLILDTTVMFGEIKLTSTSKDSSDTKILKGHWAGWSIEDLLNNRVIEVQ